MNKNERNSRLLQTSVVTANFNVASLLGYTVSVTSAATTTNRATITSTVWNWGDSTTVSTTQNAAHNCRYTGTYSITLTATDSNKNKASRSVSITVPPDNPPVASYTVAKKK
jgi:PKD repeat protein